jgi:hypothetical protein
MEWLALGTGGLGRVSRTRDVVLAVSSNLDNLDFLNQCIENCIHTIAPALAVPSQFLSTFLSVIFIHQPTCRVSK